MIMKQDGDGERETDKKGDRENNRKPFHFVHPEEKKAIVGPARNRVPQSRCHNNDAEKDRRRRVREKCQPKQNSRQGRPPPRSRSQRLGETGQTQVEKSLREIRTKQPRRISRRDPPGSVPDWRKEECRERCEGCPAIEQIGDENVK